jgi:chromosome segregation ATPase
MTNEISELKPLLLQLISKMDAGFAELRQDVTELKQGQVELKQDVTELKQDVAELKRDMGDLKRVTSSNHFVVTGRLDEQRGILTDHLAKPLEHAHQR